MTMLKSTLFLRIFIIFFALTFMISLFNMAVFGDASVLLCWPDL